MKKMYTSYLVVLFILCSITLSINNLAAQRKASYDYKFLGQMSEIKKHFEYLNSADL